MRNDRLNERKDDSNPRTTPELKLIVKNVSSLPLPPSELCPVSRRTPVDVRQVRDPIEPASEDGEHSDRPAHLHARTVRVRRGRLHVRSVQEQAVHSRQVCALGLSPTDGRR